MEVDQSLQKGSTPFIVSPALEVQLQQMSDSSASPASNVAHLIIRSDSEIVGAAEFGEVESCRVNRSVSR